MTKIRRGKLREIKKGNDDKVSEVKEILLLYDLGNISAGRTLDLILSTIKDHFKIKEVSQ